MFTVQSDTEDINGYVQYVLNELFLHDFHKEARFMDFS